MEEPCVAWEGCNRRVGLPSRQTDEVNKFRIDIEAFREFSEELGVCVTDIPQDLPGESLAELNLPCVAPESDDLAAMLRDCGYGCPRWSCYVSRRSTKYTGLLS